VSLHFFSDHGALRADAGPPAPDLLWTGPGGDGEDEGDRILLDAEVSSEAWAPISPDPGPGFVPARWASRPRRFVDGKDLGEVVAWLRAREGYPLPVRLSQIGAVVLREEGSELRRERESTDRVVTLPGDPFPWHEVEGLAIALAGHGLRLLLARLPKVHDEAELFNVELTRKAVGNRSIREMAALEEHLASLSPDIPTLVDGRLEPRSGGRGPFTPVIGVIKTQQQRYLHPLGLRTLYDLDPGQRTPVFLIEGDDRFPVASFYLRLWGRSPGYGVIRVELPRAYFELKRAEEAAYADRLAVTLFALRTRRAEYGRAAVTLDPVLRAEESLGALFSPMRQVQSQFYRLTRM
jgi:hypothetical protein